MRYIIGIDLGTTNSSVAYVDTDHPRAPLCTWLVPQLTGPGHMERLSTFPSYCYLTLPGEWPEEALGLPWDGGNRRNYILGRWGWLQGSQVPSRLVTAAKSWLCHGMAGRRDAILPTCAEEGLRVSPVEASARYLAHIAESWNWSMARGSVEEELSQQEVILTVPASFDEVARCLTAEAAKKAGFGSVTLLEEPQAAFYCWIDQHRGHWEDFLHGGDLLLVCDVGGGTSDFSLIRVVEEGASLSFQRMAVGDHLLLGGENVDVAIAHLLLDRLQEKGCGDLSPHQWMQLCMQARLLKEELLEAPPEQKGRIWLGGEGARLVGGSWYGEVTARELQQRVLSGFFSVGTWEESSRPLRRKGLRTLGLPYEEEPSILRHLALFLANHAKNPPNRLLFNGGMMKPRLCQEAVITAMKRWFPEQEIEILPTTHYEAAVARGAAYYGKVRRGLTETASRIKAGSSRTYYLALGRKEGGEKAMVVLPRGAEEGSRYVAPYSISALPNAPVSFQLYSSHVRFEDVPGALVPIDGEQLQPLPPIHTVLRFGKGESKEALPIQLALSLTTMGTLEIWVESIKTGHRWKLEFQLKGEGGREEALRHLQGARRDETFSVERMMAAKELLRGCFLGDSPSPDALMEGLESSLQLPRREWSPSVLRSLWPFLMEGASRRGRSRSHELRWWHLAGFLLRPGFGYPLDEGRVKDLWKEILCELRLHPNEELLLQQRICWRRIAAGLNRGQQGQLASSLGLPRELSSPKGRKALFDEQLRVMASLELIDVAAKVRFGKQLLIRIEREEGAAAERWALGRIGARHLLRATLAHVVPPDVCVDWVERLLKIPVAESLLPLFLQLARCTGHREIDLPVALRQRIIDGYAAYSPKGKLQEILMNPVAWNVGDEELMFGERLPPGLLLEECDAIREK